MDEVLDFLEQVAFVIQVWNALSGGTLLPIVGTVVVFAAACFVWVMAERVHAAKARAVLPARAGHQVYDPAQDPGTDRLLADLHTPTSDDLDGLATDWDKQMRRRGDV